MAQARGRRTAEYILADIYADSESEEPKPSRDTVPIPPEAAASEKTSNPATASTTTTAKTVPEAAALFAETTEAVENVQAITAASKTNESVTDRRVEDFDPTTATTPSASTPTTKTYHSSAMQNQYSSTTGSSTARSLRTQEEATSSSTAAVATNKTDTTVPPIGATTTRSDTQQTSPITRKSTISQEPTTSTSSAAKLRYTSSYSEPKDPPKTKANTTEYMTTRSTTTQQTAPTTKFDSAITKTTQHRTNAATSTTEASARITLARKRETTFTSPPPFSNEETAEPPKTFREQPTTTTSRQSFVTTSTLDDTIAEEENVTTRETVPIRDGFKTMCEPNNITVFVDKAIIEKYEREYGPLHFNKDDGQNCEGVEYEGHYRYTIAPNILGCGTQFVVNDTHVDFTNTVSNWRQHDESYKSMLDDNGYILIGGAHMKSIPLIHMNIQCTFPIEMTVRTDLIPNLRADVLTFNVSGVGQFSAIMQLFRDDEYRNPYFASPSIAMDERLRVGVTLLHNKDEDISIAVRKCWATRMRAMDFGTNYSLINDYCPLERTLNGDLVILENGQSKRARWEGPVFKFTLFDEVWLHCALKVCFGDSCQKDCNSSGRSRKRRSVIDIETFGAVVSAGPIFRKTKQDENTDAHGEVSPESGNSDDQKQTEATIIVIFSVLCGVILLSCILFVSLFSKRRRSRRAKETESMTRPESIASSTLGDRGRNMWESGRYEVTASPVRISQMEAETLSVLNAHEIEHFADCSEIVVEENCHTDRNFIDTEGVR